MAAPKDRGGLATRRTPSGAASLITVGGSLALVLGIFFVAAWMFRRSLPAGAMSLPNEVVEVLGARQGRQHVIITGRDAAPELVAAADLVMETTKVKHPMDAGQKGQRGIEW